MSGSALMVFVAVFGGIALFAILLRVVAVRVQRAGDADTLALRAAQVAAECQDLLPGPEFLWAVWQDTAKAAAMKTLVRDARDEVVATVIVPVVPLDGVLEHFDLGGRRYESRKVSLLSNRTCLREAGHDEVLLSADHEPAPVTFFRGDGETELFVLPMRTVLHRYRPIEAGAAAIDKLITGLTGSAHASVLTLPPGHCTPLEQVFVLASR